VPSDSNAELKTKIIRGVVLAARKNEELSTLLSDIGKLEKLNPCEAPSDSCLLNGTWSLIGTYSSDGIRGQHVAPFDNFRSRLQVISDGIYEALYKNARWSWLAGADDGATAARSYQNIDLARKN